MFLMCKHCACETNLEFWVASLNRQRWICKNCGLSGWTTDPDAPIFITEAEHQKYAIQLQTDCTFVPPKLPQKPIA